MIEESKVAKNTILASMDVISPYTNIPQEDGIEIVCRTYETFYGNELPIPTHFLREMLRLILKENSFYFNGNRNGNKNGSIFLLTSLWQKLRVISSTKALTYHSFGKDTLRTSFLYGTQTKRQ